MPYRDTQCGAKILRRNIVEKVFKYLKMSRWAFDVDLLYALRKIGYRLKEYPTKGLIRNIRK